MIKYIRVKITLIVGLLTGANLHQSCHIILSLEWHSPESFFNNKWSWTSSVTWDRRWVSFCRCVWIDDLVLVLNPTTSLWLSEVNWIDGLYFIRSTQNTLRCQHNASNFFKHPRNRHHFACPRGCSMCEYRFDLYFAVVSKVLYIILCYKCYNCTWQHYPMPKYYYWTSSTSWMWYLLATLIIENFNNYEIKWQMS